MFLPILIVAAGIVGALGDVCPGGKWTCATGMTCCTLPSGHEACCPYTNATCCADKIHCCPMGTTCSTKGGGHCQDQLGSKVVEHSLLKPSHSTHHNSSKAVAILTNEICGDGSQCPDDSTCCAMKNGRFGCCPFPSAVCCTDKLHCCPEGTSCDKAGYCHSQQADLLYSNRTLTLNLTTDCPGGEFKCPQSSTCCSVGEGDWGCCPLPDAVCCSDRQHCCPTSFRCIGSGSCAK